MEKVRVGQKIYIVDDRRYRRNGVIQECSITKVGRKYFYIDLFKSNERFRLKDLRHDGGGYTDRIYVFLSPEGYIDLMQKRHLFGEIRALFAGYRAGRTVELAQLKQIASILGIEELEIKMSKDNSCLI